MPYGCSPSSRYRWRAAREPDTFHYGPFSPATEDRYSGFLALGLLDLAVVYWPVTLGLLALSGVALDDELHRRLGLVRRHRSPRRRSSA